MKRIVFTLCALLMARVLAQAQGDSQPVQLTVQSAIEQALRANLSVRVASAQVGQSAGTEERRLSSLLPHATADHVTNYQNHNLQALGLSSTLVPIPTVVGPLSNYDYRIYASQAVVDRQAYHSYKASQDQQSAAKLSYKDTRDLVIRQTAGLYLDAQTAQATVEADLARVDTSKALLKLAQDQHDLGLATGIDLVRAQVQLQRDQQTLLVARDNYQTSLLNMQRFIGMEPGEPIELAARLEFHAIETPPIAEATQTALQARSDYRSLFAQREALVQQQKASHARYYPRLSVDGNYGPLGRSYGTMPGIGLIEGVVSITVFDRDREGEQKELTAQLQKIDAQISDMRRGIEQELRKAILDLQSAEQQVSVTQSGLDLAQRELVLAKDRFQNGLAEQHRGGDRAIFTAIGAGRSYFCPGAAFRCCHGPGTRAGIDRKQLSEIFGWRIKEASMKRIIPIVLLLLLVTAGVVVYRRAHGDRQQPNEMKLSGNIEAHESLVGFKVTGRIIELPVEEGQAVQSGQLLARLDDADYRQAVAVDQATAAMRDRQLKLALAGSRTQDVQAAYQSVLDAKADLAQKQKDLVRYNALYGKDEIAGQTRDQQQTAVERAKATYERQQQMYNELLEGTRKEEIAVDQASLRQAHQTVGLSQVRLDYTTLKAPLSGVITVREAELGEVVSPGTPVYTLADLDHIWVRVYVPETELGRVRWGQEVSVGTDTYPDKRYHGRISFIASDAEFTPKSVQTEQERVTLVYRVKVDIDNANHELKPGMPADVYVPLK